MNVPSGPVTEVKSPRAGNFILIGQPFVIVSVVPKDAKTSMKVPV